MLTLSWPKTRWSATPLPRLILLSAFVHSLAFVLLQVVPKEKVTAPEREREIELLSAELPEHQALLGRMMVLAPRLALEQGCNPYPQGGFRIVTNTGAEGGQEVHHLHWHVMGGPRPWLRG